MMTSSAKTDGEELAKRLVKDVHADLKKALIGARLWGSLDYFEISTTMQKAQNSPFPNFEWLSCAPVTRGGNHYVYIGTIFNGRHKLIFVGKTSEGFESACAVANRCAHELGA